jgi:O-antigen ligase
LGIIDVSLNGFASLASSKLLLLVGFVFILASCLVLFENKKDNLIHFTIAISAVVALVNVIALSNYFLNMDFYDKLLLQSKSIPIPNMHHIHFGIINACVIAILVGLIITKKLKNNLQCKLTTTLAIIIIISFHILSSRTGLFSFYVGVLVSLIIHTFRKKSFKAMILGVLVILSSLSLSYYFSNSFRNKIENSIEDFNSWGKGEEINFKSMAMRIEASKMCIHIILDNPLGVGANAQEDVLQATYIDQKTPLDEENRVGPHNQFLEFGVKYGWVGMILLAIFFISLIPAIRQSSFPLVGVITIIFASLFFESLLERQTSIFLFSFFIPLGISLFKHENP